MAIPAVRRPDERLNWATSTPFFLVHLACLAAIFTGVPARALVLGAVLYFARMFFITAGYHRYFAHRSYRMGRPMQFLMALGGTTAAQKGPLWWAGNHRDHHRFADTDQDTHSPLRGFWWSHVGWILCDRYGSLDYDLRRPTRKHRLASRIKDGNFDFGMFRAYWTKASGAIATARADAGERMGSTRQSLDEAVHSALESAEELARVTRRTRRAGFAE